MLLHAFPQGRLDGAVLDDVAEIRFADACAVEMDFTEPQLIPDTHLTVGLNPAFADSVPGADILEQILRGMVDGRDPQIDFIPGPLERG